MARAKLTAGRIRDFNCSVGKSVEFLRDTDTPGLGVRATTGTKAFIFQSKLKDGSTIRRTIGDVRVWGLDEAKAEVRRLQILIDQGIDPRELDREKSEAKAAVKTAHDTAKLEQENRQRYTLRALCDAYTEFLATKGKKQSARHARSIFKCHVFDSHPDIAALPARDVTSDHAATLVRKVIEQGKDRTAGVLRSYLSAAFNASRKARYDAKLPSSFIAYQVQTNPVEPIATIAVQRGDRTLNADEMKAYMAALSDDDLADQALKLALFSGGQRMAQLLRAKVSDYDKYTQTLRLWDGKGKRTTPREHLLPLAPKAAVIVQKLLTRAEVLKTQLLFSSFGSTQLVDTTPGKRATSICTSMKCEAFNLRDIRRTCETMLAGIGISRDTRAQLLSHGLSGVQAAHYDRHTYTDEKRAALVAWEQRLDDIETGRNSENVVQIIRRRKATSG